MRQIKAGRPAGGRSRVQREGILKTALKILDAKGPEGLSMRNLAARLKVNPMTLYHHVGNRSDLLRALSDHVYGQISKKVEESSGGARERIEVLLTSYHEEVQKHPNLSLSLFANPDAFSEETRRITRHLMNLLRTANLSQAKTDLWLSILVDFTHGSSIATAMNSTGERLEGRRRSPVDEYSRGLSELLDCLFPVRSR